MKASQAGEGFGAEGIEFQKMTLPPDGIRQIAAASVGEKTDDVLAFGGKRDVAVIYEDSGGGAEDLLRKDEGAGRSGEPGFGAERMEKLKADGFAALPFSGIDIEVRSDGGMDEAMSVDDPEGENGELGVRADQVFTKQSSEPGHHLEWVFRKFV